MTTRESPRFAGLRRKARVRTAIAILERENETYRRALTDMGMMKP
jgi:hypothetical protein